MSHTVIIQKRNSEVMKNSEPDDMCRIVLRKADAQAQAMTFQKNCWLQWKQKRCSDYSENIANTHTGLPQAFHLCKAARCKVRELCLIGTIMVILILGYLEINILKKMMKNLST